MKQKVYKKTALVFNGLFYRTCKVSGLSREGAKMFEYDITPTERFGGVYRLGKYDFGFYPTYQLHIKNFISFVKDLEGVNIVRAKIWPDFTSILSCGRDYTKGNKAAALQEEQESDKETQRFLTKYKEALEALTFSQSLKERQVPESHIDLLNMQLFPRAGNEQRLFGRFIKAYLELRQNSRLKIQGPKHGTQSIPAHLLRIAEKMHRKGKGTKAGSLETIADMVAGKIGHLELSDNETKASHDKAITIRENIYRTLVRHFARIKQSRLK